MRMGSSEYPRPRTGGERTPGASTSLVTAFFDFVNGFALVVSFLFFDDEAGAATKAEDVAAAAEDVKPSEDVTAAAAEGLTTTAAEGSKHYICGRNMYKTKNESKNKVKLWQRFKSCTLINNLK